MIILGLGSNIGNRIGFLRQALQHLQAIPELKIEAVSPIYESEALVPPNQISAKMQEWNLPFLNCALRLQTNLSPEALIKHTKGIEQTMQREKKARWYPRNIDIDILAWDDVVMDKEHLHIPHRDLDQRPFALWPLADLAPQWQHPLLKKTAEKLSAEWGSRFDGQAPLKTRQINADINATKLVAIVNVTPDSFSDGGLCFTPENALLQAKQCIAEGATILDIGAESTRPGATPLTAEQEWNRLSPVLNLLKQELPQAQLSIDTYHAQTVEKCINLGINFLNDITGMSNTRMREIARAADIPIVFMHSLTIPANKNSVIAEDKNPTKVIFTWAQQKIEDLLRAGFKIENLIFDPGVGFGNTSEQALKVLNDIELFHQLGVKLYVGHSRKSFLKALPASNYINKDFDTSLITAYLANKNIHYLRVHNVAMNKRALDVSAVL